MTLVLESSDEEDEQVPGASGPFQVDPQPGGGEVTTFRKYSLISVLSKLISDEKLLITKPVTKHDWTSLN